MFEYDIKRAVGNAAHHPFTSPYEADMDKLESDPGPFVRLAYDWCSMYRAWVGIDPYPSPGHPEDHLRALGMSDEEAARFGFFLDALSMETPPMAASPGPLTDR